MGNDVEDLGNSTHNPDHSISLLDRPKDNTSFAALITSFPPHGATQSVCRRWITNLATTRELDDKVDQSAIHCLGRDLWGVRSASDAMVLLSDQRQLTEGMKLLLPRDMEAAASQVGATFVSSVFFSPSPSAPVS